MIPKPQKREKVPKRIARSTTPIKSAGRIRGLSPAKYGNFRQRVRYANELWRHLIYRKADPHGLCLRCMLRPFVAACHLWIKGKYGHVRFDIDNGWPCCQSCHTIIDSDHQAKEDFGKRMLGADGYERQRLRAISPHKQDMVLVILELEMLSR